MAYTELHEQAKRATAVALLRAVITFFAYRLHTVLTKGGIPFTHRASDRYAFMHLFDRVCRQHGIAHRPAPVGHPWTNGQPPVDRRRGAHEPDGAGGHRAAVPLREP